MLNTSGEVPEFTEQLAPRLVTHDRGGGAVAASPRTGSLLPRLLYALPAKAAIHCRDRSGMCPLMGTVGPGFRRDCETLSAHDRLDIGNQLIFIIRLAQIAEHARTQRAGSHPLVGVRGDQNGGDGPARSHELVI